MSKLYSKEITCCLVCPHQQSIVFTHYCMLDKERVLDDISEIPLWCKLKSIKLGIPSLDLLEEYLRKGYYIEFQDNECILFHENGDAFISGDTLREMLINLIMADE